jgi:LysR family transcriptional regulator, cyn operon transcriptional activator
MNLRHLRTFVLIADSGGIAHASDRLHLSSPAASRQILALENELRVQLFDRVGRRLQLTPEGEDLLLRSRRLLNDAESLTERARALKSGHTGLLRVRAAPQVIESFLAPFVPRYRRRHPGVDVHLVEDASGNLPTRLEHGEVQLIEVPAGDGRFPERLSNPTHVLAVLPRGHQLVRRAVLDVTEIAEEPFCFSDANPRQGAGSRRRSKSRAFGRGSYWRAVSRIRLLRSLPADMALRLSRQTS